MIYYSSVGWQCDVPLWVLIDARYRRTGTKMTSQLEDMPCLARLKAMDLRPGQHDQIRRLLYHMIAKFPGTPEVLGDRRQALLNWLMERSTFCCRHQVQNTPAEQGPTYDLHCALSLSLSC